MSPTTTIDRRAVLRCAGAACVATGAAVTLAACGGGDDTSSGTTSNGDATTSASGGSAGVTTSDIPVGGGTVYKDAGYVITQPTDGQFKAFTSLCTHQHLPVGNVADGTINCFNHGSKFDITTGAVVNGPATKPLPAMTVTVDGDTITVSS